MKKFDLLLFIDDDPATNFLHEIVLEESGICDRYLFFNSAEDALAYLVDVKSKKDIPQFIFLDINMPRVNGWEFLEKYKSLKTEKSPVIIMLTTSLSPTDQEKADSNENVYKLYSKPLKVDYLVELSKLLQENEE